MKIPGLIFDLLKMPVTALTTRQVFRGLLIFSFLVFLMSYGIAALYPTFEGELTDEHIGSDALWIDVLDEDNGDYQLSWMPDENATLYTLYEDTVSRDFNNSNMIYNGTLPTVVDPSNGPEIHYYQLVGIDSNGTAILILDVATNDPLFHTSPYDEFLDNPLMQAFVGGGELELFSFKGFVTAEFMSWIPLIAVLYISYLASGAIAREVDDKTLDPILATPISRTRFFLEKYIAFFAVSFFLVLAAFIGLYGGAVAIGEPSGWLIPAVWGVLPLVVAVQSVAILASVLFNEPRRAMGVSLMFIMLSYIIHLGSNLSDALRDIKSWSIFTHYDYNAIIVQEKIIGADAGVLIGFSIVVTLIALYLFNKKDIPS